MPRSTADIIRDCRAGLVCAYDTASVAAGLTELYQWRKKRSAWEFAETRRQEYAADTAVARLAALFEEAARHAHATPRP